MTISTSAGRGDASDQARAGSICWTLAIRRAVTRILQGMRESQADISPMPDHKEELAEYFQEVLGDYRDYLQDTGYDDRIRIEAIVAPGTKRQGLPRGTPHEG